MHSFVTRLKQTWDLTQRGKAIVDICLGHVPKGAVPALGRPTRKAGRDRGARQRREQILRILVKGQGLRAAVDRTGASYSMVERLFIDAATACADLQDNGLRELTCNSLELRSVRCFTQEEIKTGQTPMSGGDVWTWLAIDADTKLIASWRIGNQAMEVAEELCDDVASRIERHVQIAPGRSNDINRLGDADPYKLRTTIRPVARNGVQTRSDRRQIDEQFAPELRTRLPFKASLPRASLKKIEFYALAVALHCMHYNYCLADKELGRSPAMAAGVTGRLWTIDDLVQVLENWQFLNEGRKPAGSPHHPPPDHRP